MAAFGCSWTKALAVAVLMVGAGGMALAQSNQHDPSPARQELPGSLTGKLTDLHSKPLGGVAVVLRNQATGVEARTVTLKNGDYRFTGLEAGTYTLMAESPQLGRGQLGEIVVNAGAEAHVQAAMEFSPFAASPAAEPALEAQGTNQPRPKPPESAQAVAKPAAPSAERQQAAAASAPVVSAPAVVAASGLAVNCSEQTPARSAATATPAAAPASVTASAVLATPSARSSSQIAGEAAEQTAARVARPAQTAPQPIPAALQESSPVSAAVTTTMSAAELQALPVSGRHWQDFVLENAPASVTAAGGQGEISLRGAGQQPVEKTVDGMSLELAFGSTGGSGQHSSGKGALGEGGTELAGMARVGMGGHGLAVSETAIREVQTAAGNVEASADRAAGGSMDVETESGGKELHGQGFVFDRQNDWGAQNPFSQWVTETCGLATQPTLNCTNPPPPFPEFDDVQYTSDTLNPLEFGPPQSYTPTDREMTWGIGAGSRIRRKNLFWFAALDDNHRNGPGLSMVKHPYLLAPTDCVIAPCAPTPTGFFAQPTNDELQVLCARLGLTEPGQTEACTNPLVQALAPYSQMLESLTGLLGPAPRTATQWTGFGRIDWQASERQSFTLEGIGAYWNSPGGGLTGLSEHYGNHSFGSSKATEEWLLGRWQAYLTPNLLSTAQFSAGAAVQQARPGTPSAFEQSFLQGNAWGQLPQIVVDDRYGFTIGNPSRFGKGNYPDERSYQGREQLDWARGSLLVNSGFQMIHSADATSLLRNQTGSYHYSNVENFISDALAFQNFPADPLDPLKAQHNCDETGRVWRDSAGNLRGLGYLPCYSYYSQTLGPSDWHLSTNDWAGYAAAQWQAGKLLVMYAGLRWEREELPPPLAALNNPELPLTEKLPNLGNQWGPRVSLAVGSGAGHWPLLRLGYGMYYGRTTNLAVETALTQTGSPAGDLSIFMRPTDDLPNDGGGAPPFPYVLTGDPGNVIKPGAVEFAPRFRNPEVHQAVAAVEVRLPGHIEVTASAMVSLGRRLPVSIDTNFDSSVNPQTITYNVVDGAGAGPIKTRQITVPFYATWPSASAPSGLAGRLNPDYQQITNIESRANSTYEAGMLRVAHYGRKGLSFHAYYVYAHAMDWNPNESAQVAGNDVLDPADFSQEYGTSNLDVRHAAGVTAIYQAPWKLAGLAGKLGNGWMVSGVGHFRSGLPYTMRTSGSLAEEFTDTGAAIVGLGPGMNGSGGDNRVYGVGRNTYRYPFTWKADLRLGRRFDLGGMRQLELMAESFNLFNHENVTELETTGYSIESGSPPSTSGAPGSLPTLNFMTGPELTAGGAVKKAASTAFGQPLNINATNFYRPRQFQFGLRFRF